MTASAHRAKEMRRTPVRHTQTQAHQCNLQCDWSCAKLLFHRKTYLTTYHEDVTTKFGSHVAGFSNNFVKHSWCWSWSTCYIEVGCDFAVSQCKPDESKTHTQSSRHISQIIALTWNIKTRVLNLVAILRKQNLWNVLNYIWFNSTRENAYYVFEVRSACNNLKCLKNFQ